MAYSYDGLVLNALHGVAVFNVFKVGQVLVLLLDILPLGGAIIRDGL